MTTTIKVTSHNYPALVEVMDLVDGAPSPEAKAVENRILRPDDGEQTFYCTTTRVVRVTDLQYDDPRVVALVS